VQQLCLDQSEIIQNKAGVQ